MPDPRPVFCIDQLWGLDTRPDPAWEEAKRRLWAMTPDERRAAMYAGRLSLRLSLQWASHAAHEVPRLDGEWWFIAIATPEHAESPDRRHHGRRTVMTARPASGRAPRSSRLGAAALRYAAYGWPVLALHTPTREGGCSCQRPACPKPGKHPRTRRGLRDASTDPAQVRAWWTRWPHANLALATGRLLVLDVDGPAGRAALAALERAHAPLPVTLTAATGRGTHLYFDAGEQRIANSAGRLGQGLDIRGHGGYIIAPPSRHAAGQRYRWSTRTPPAPLPAWLAELLSAAAPAPRRAALPAGAGDRRQRYFAAALRAELADVAGAQDRRNDTLNRAAFRLAQLAAATDVDLDELTEQLLSAALTAGLGAREARATIASGLRAGAQHPRAGRS